MPSLFGKIFAGGNERELKRLLPFVDEVNDLEPEVQALGDDELRAKTDPFRRRCQDGESLDDLLPEAFAVVREAIRRRLGQRAFAVPVLGALGVPQGKI